MTVAPALRPRGPVARLKELFVAAGPPRILTLLGLLVGTFIVPNIPSPGVLRVILIASTLFALLIELVGPGEHRYFIRAIEGAVAGVSAGIFIPELWASALITVVCVCIWFGLVASTAQLYGIAIPAFGALTAVGITQNPNGWGSSLALSALMVVLSSQFARHSRELVRDREATMTRALTTSMSFVHVADFDSGTVVSIKGPIEEVTGWSAEEWMTIDHRELIHPDDLEDFWIPKANPGHSVERKARFRTKSGGYVWLRDVSHASTAPNGKVFLHGYTIDITEIERANEVIRRQADTDELTGLANRSKYIRELDARLERGEQLSVMIMDIDRFKAINDTLGHEFGDDVLRTISARLRPVLKGADLIARHGGDEFAVISSQATTEEDALELADEMAYVVSRAMEIKGMTLSTTLSIGIALAPSHGTDAQTLLRHADIAMYDSKERGHSLTVFNTDIQHTPVEELTLTGSLGVALERGELELYFQPKVSLETGLTVGFEGLSRWRHPTLGLLSPDRFVHLVTISDESHDFADHTIREGIKFAIRCRDQGHPVPVAVNLSTRSLLDETLPARTELMLRILGLEPHMLIVEITEADIMDVAGHSSQVVERLAALGVRISIDDFGTGYSSFARLVDLPISEIKIDRKFITNSTRNHRDKIVIQSIVDLARGLDLHIVAEGVETDEEVALLLSTGCGEGQGYLFSRPLSAADALTALANPASTSPTGDRILNKLRLSNGVDDTAECDDLAYNDGSPGSPANVANNRPR